MSTRTLKTDIQTQAHDTQTQIHIHTHTQYTTHIQKRKN